MNKKELVNHVAEAAGVSKKDANLLVTSVVEGIKGGLTADGKVSLVGFGTFSLAGRKARTARNPQNGDTIEVPAKTVPKFKASKVLKEMVENVEVE